MSVRFYLSDMTPDDNISKTTRRSRIDFLTVVTCAVGAVTVAAGLWGLGRTMAPSAAIVAAPELRIDLSEVPVGEERRYMFEGRPIFVRHLTSVEIFEALEFDTATLGDKYARNANLSQTALATLKNRTINSNGIFTVLWGLCANKRMVPLSLAGGYGGWFCSREATHFDVFGRAIRGRARNLDIPKYQLVAPGQIVLQLNQQGPSQEDLDRLVFGTAGRS